MNIDTIPDIEVIEHLDFAAELGCESAIHVVSGTHSGDKAEYMQFGPCTHVTGLRCAGWAAHLERNIARDINHQVHCQVCGYKIAATDLALVPVANAT